jgi:hypothetical protein
MTTHGHLVRKTMGFMVKCLRSHIATFHFLYLTHFNGARGSVVVKALCYKPEGRGFEI